jgi:cytochrome c6
MKKLLIFFAAILMIISSCTKASSSDKETATADPTASPGQLVYTKHCKLCHGSKGDLGISGAANLSITLLSQEEIKQVVVNGRKGMPAWKGQLSEQEVQEVSAYVLTLKK